MFAFSFVPWALNLSAFENYSEFCFWAGLRALSTLWSWSPAVRKKSSSAGLRTKKGKVLTCFHSDSSYYINDKPRNSFCINVSLENTWPFQSRLFCRRISMNADSLFKVRIQNTVIERLLTWSSRCLQPSRSSWSFIISLSTPSTIVASPSRFALQN